MKAQAIVITVALAAAVLLTTCGEEDPCDPTEGPPRMSYDCVYEASFRTCATGVEDLGVRGFARSLDVKLEENLEAIARAFAEPYTRFRGAAHEGCLAALQEA